MFPWLPALKARSLSKSTNLAPPRIGTKQNETKRRRSIVNRLISEISWFWIVECWRVCQRTCTILPTWRVAEWWIYTCPTDDLLPYRKSYADVGLGNIASLPRMIVEKRRIFKISNEWQLRLLTYFEKHLNLQSSSNNKKKKLKIGWWKECYDL